MPDAGLELASMEVDCPAIPEVTADHRWVLSVDDVFEWHQRFCSCNTTQDEATVPRFPGVRVPCRGWPVHPDLLEMGESYCTKDKDCLCQGRGWTVSDKWEDWLEAAFQLDDSVILSRFKGGQFEGLYYCLLPKRMRDSNGDTPLEALQQALLKMTAWCN